MKPTDLSARLLAAICLAAGLCVCLPGRAIAQAAPARPKLVVFLVVDGLPQRQVTAYRDQLAPDGFARFLDRGAWFADAHYGHAYTVTGAGHATMLTGAYPDRTGIVGNSWRDQTTGEDVYCAGDTSATYIGNKTEPLDGTSPKNLKVETVGDVLRRLDPRAKVLAMSGKDRGAILPAGKTGTAYMYMETGEFASTTYYMKEHPAWVNEFNGRRLADRYFKAEWKPLLPEDAYARSVPDDQPWFGRNGGRLPMMMGNPAAGAPDRNFYRFLLRSPFADMLTLDFARAAIAGEKLGQDDVPDILSVSLSGHDYVNHSFSAESRLSHDHFLHLDRMLQAFFRDLDAAVGKDNYLAVLTSDHGFAPNPEFAASRGAAAGRFNSTQAMGRINAELEKRFGQPRLMMGYSGATLLLDKRLMAQARLEPGAVADAARNALLAEPGIAAAYTRAELLAGSRGTDPFFNQIRKAWHKDVSGEVQYVFKPFWMPGSDVATHGSPHAYDTHVPVMLYGPPWLKPGRMDGRVEVVDIAPTLARILNIPPPSANQGTPLPLP